MTEMRKHDIYIKLSGSQAQEKCIVTVTSSTADCHPNRKVAARLVIHDFLKFADIPGFDPLTCESFLVVGVQWHDKRFYDSMANSLHKAARVYLDSSGTEGLLTVPSELDKRTDPRLAVPDVLALKCFVRTPHRVTASSSGTGAGPSNVHSIEQSRLQEGHTRGTETAAAAAAADHYNQLTRNRESRHLTYIYHMRQLNNYIKDELISKGQELCSRPAGARSGYNRHVSVLDIGCGKGGDIFKWFKSKHCVLSRYVGVDIARSSLEEFASQRIKDSNDREKVTHLIEADMSRVSLTESMLNVHRWTTSGGSWAQQVPLTVDDRFDIASCQFAMHYFFKSRNTADHFFSEVSRHLRPGGVFITTTIDCRVIRELLLKIEFGDDFNDPSEILQDSKRVMYSTREGADRTLCFKNELGHLLLKINFHESVWKRIVSSCEVDSLRGGIRSNRSPAASDDGFGLEYHFNLFDGDDASAVNAPEWLVPLGPALFDVTAAHGLTLEKSQNFHEFLEERHRDPSERGTVTAAEWEINRLYVILIFRAADNASSGTRPRSPEGIPPPSVSAFHRPRSPDGPPPPSIGSSAYRPRSPDIPPPTVNQTVESGYRPRSPDGPPMSASLKSGSYRPRSPDTAPPASHLASVTFRPRSPDGPPPSGLPAYKPRSPDAPPPRPRSPNGPPPGTHLTTVGYRPRSPDGPPLLDGLKSGAYRPRSPDTAPPSTHIASAGYRPRSPDGPLPPSINAFRPRSPDYKPRSPNSTPPSSSLSSYRPRSPDVPPPFGGVTSAIDYRPRSPSGPPPLPSSFRPRSPDAPPPTSITSYRPRSPDGPPPPNSFYPIPTAAPTLDNTVGAKKRPRSPDSSPPPAVGRPRLEQPSIVDDRVILAMDIAGVDTATWCTLPIEEQARLTGIAQNVLIEPPSGADDEMETMVQIRDKAIEIVGGEDAWEELSDAQVDFMLLRARARLGFNLLS